MATATGGDKITRYLTKVVGRLTAGEVDVGFLEGATYPAKPKSADRLLKGIDKFNAAQPTVQPNGRRPASLLKKYKASVANRVGPAAPDRDGLPVAQVAFWNNFGTETAPPRPFFSNMIAETVPGMGPKMVEMVHEGSYNTKRVLTLAGTYLSDELVRRIKDWPADNAPLTVAIKGFNKGLIDKGVMERNVDYVVKT